MHGRIFQIVETEVSPLDYVSSTYFDDHWFLQDIADSVGLSDRNEDIIYFRGVLSGIAEVDDSGRISFFPGALEKYLEPKYKKFQESVLNLQEYSFNDFKSSKLIPELFEIRSLVNDRFGFYVISEWGDFQTFDEWIRWNDLTKLYYIGSTFDYHF